MSLLWHAWALVVSAGPADVFSVLASCGRRGTQTIEKTRHWKTPVATAKLPSLINMSWYRDHPADLIGTCLSFARGPAPHSCRLAHDPCRFEWGTLSVRISGIVALLRACAQVAKDGSSP